MIDAMTLVRSLLFCLAAALMAFFAPALAQQASQPRRVVLIEIDGVIGPPSARHLRDAIQKAEDISANALILQINTPGGLETSMRDMAQDIQAAPVPVIGFVAPPGGRAASAGTFILYATHVAAMAPGTNVGAASPVELGAPPRPTPGDRVPEEAAKETKKQVESGDTMSRKAMNDAVAFIRSLAEKSGRNVEWAEQAVRDAASVSAQEALRLGVIDLMADNVDDLLNKVDGRSVNVRGRTLTLQTRGATIERIEPSFMTRVLDVLANPNIALLLMMIGVYGIIFELANPGTWVPGVIGIIALVLGLYALNQLEANYAGIALIALGVALMIAEAFTPTWGALGIVGIAAFLFGAAMLIDADLPPEYQLSWPLIIGLAALTAGFVVLVVGYAVRAHRKRVATGAEGLVGQRARVLEWSNGEGFVWAEGERWQAEGPADLKPNQNVRITRLESLRLHVVAEEPKGEPR
jgi:membrane-bound serine protease (ClpP class)